MGSVAAVQCCCGQDNVSAHVQSDGEIIHRDEVEEGDEVLLSSSFAQAGVSGGEAGNKLASISGVPTAPNVAIGNVEVGDKKSRAGGEIDHDCGLSTASTEHGHANPPEHDFASESSTDAPLPVVPEVPAASHHRSAAAKRPAEVFSVTFDLRGEAKGLGLELGAGPRGRTLVVKRIAAGVAKDYNSSKKGSPIHVGDHVYEVNGVKDNSMAMIDQFRTSAKLEIVYGPPAK